MRATTTRATADRSFTRAVSPSTGVSDETDSEIALAGQSSGPPSHNLSPLLDTSSVPLASLQPRCMVDEILVLRSKGRSQYALSIEIKTTKNNDKI